MCRHPQRRFTVQRYYKICGCARKIALKCDFSGVGCKAGDLLAGIAASTKQTGGKYPNPIGGEITIIGNLFRKLVNFFRKGDYFFGNQVNLFRNQS